MKEMPLLCSTPVVQSMLEGRKSQTRRLINPQAMVNEKGQLVWGNAPKSKTRQIEKGLPMSYGLKDYSQYQPGDLLYVRETWGVGARPDPFQGSVDGIEFKADAKYIDDIEALPLHFYDDFDYSNYDKKGWRPSIHMPKSIARIWLQVTDVRVERLKDISDSDAIAEGIESYVRIADIIAYKNYSEFARKDFLNVSKYGFDNGKETQSAPVASFCTLWMEINGRESWISNPWVWVVSFKILSTTGKPDLNNQ